MRFPNQHQRSFLLSVLLLIILISSCAPATANSIQSVTPPIVSSSTSPVVSNTPTLIPSPTIETVSTPTTQSSIEVSLEKECIPIEDKMPDDLGLSGVWVRNSGKPYLETVDGLTLYGVPLKGGSIFNTDTGNAAIAPNGKNLAYIDTYMDSAKNRTEKRILRIINSSGHSLSMDYWILDWQWLIGWTDNQHLAIRAGNKELFLLDPFKGKWEKLQQPSWINSIDHEYWYHGYQGPFYSPNLDAILIPSGPIFELRDSQTGNTIYEGDGYLTPWDLDWSADGSTLVIGLGKSLNVVRRNEQAVELDASKLGINSVNYPKLSPNGQKFVFTSYWSGKLFLFDINQLEIRKLCSDEFNYWENAVWSPDGRFVVQEAYKSYYDWFDILIDTQQMRAYKLISGQYQHRLAWLAKP